MRSSVLTVIAGVAAALCFSSIFFDPMVGQFFFSLSVIPLFLVLLISPTPKIWLSLGGSAIAFTVLGFTDALNDSLWLSVLGFIVLALLPAVFVAGVYSRPLDYDEDGNPSLFVPAEVPVISLCFLSLMIFYTAVAFSSHLFGNDLYTVFYDYSLGFVTQIQTQLNLIDAHHTAQQFEPTTLAQTSAVNLAGLITFIFILNHFFNLIFAQWVLRKLYLTDHPLPKMSNLYFPHHFVIFSIIAILAYLYANYAEWSQPIIFALTPPLVAFGLPLIVQGLSTAHRFLVKRLVKVGMISVYLGLFLGLFVMPFQMVFILFSLGVANNIFVYTKNRFA